MDPLNCLPPPREAALSKKGSMGTSVVVVGCSNPNCHQLAVGKARSPDLDTLEKLGEKLECCTHCREARYCSKACKENHWSVGHKSECTISKSFKELADVLTNDPLYNHFLARLSMESRQGVPPGTRRLIHFDFNHERDVAMACDKDRLLHGERVDVDVQLHSLEQLERHFGDEEDEGNYVWKCAIDACRDYSVGLEAAVVITMTTSTGGVLIKPFVVKFHPPQEAQEEEEEEVEERQQRALKAKN